jgi:hypothetical protein
MSILIAMFVGTSIMGENSFSNIKTYTDYSYCQFSSTNLFQFMNGINLTSYNNTSQPDPNYKWKGILAINDTYYKFYSSVLTFKSSKLTNNIYLSSTDAALTQRNYFEKKFEEFKLNLNTKNFSKNDPNGQYISELNYTYYCAYCKNLTNVIDAMNDIDRIFKTKQDDMNQLRASIYNTFIDKQNWNKFYGKLNTTFYQLRESTYRIMLFYDYVQNFYDGFDSKYKFYSMFNYLALFFIFVSFISLLIAYKFVRDCNLF